MVFSLLIHTEIIMNFQIVQETLLHSLQMWIFIAILIWNITSAGNIHWNDVSCQKQVQTADEVWKERHILLLWANAKAIY